jgi:hypothetical protein
MTINGKPVCEVGVRASTLTIFQASVGRPLDFSNNPDLDPYALPGSDRDVVKAFITATFGNGQCTIRWSPEAAEEYEKKIRTDRPPTTSSRLSGAGCGEEGLLAPRGFTAGQCATAYLGQATVPRK